MAVQTKVKISFDRYTCEHCGRGPQVSLNRPHSLHKTKRLSIPNVQAVTVDGKRMRLCTRCLKTVYLKQKTNAPR